jgi:dUTP pyrophosphatase
MPLQSITSTNRITKRTLLICFIIIQFLLTTTTRTMSSATTSLVSAAAIVPSSSSASSYSTHSFYTKLPLYVQRLSEHAIIPTRGSEYAAGFDLSASEDTIVKGNGGRALVKTDLRIACPPGTYVRIAPRSGLAYKFGIDVGAGVIDADYRGPVGVILFNFGTDDFTIKRGDRIAQAILEQICIPSSIIDVPIDDELPSVGTRGENGFGSTGISTNADTSAPQISMTVFETDGNKKQRMDVEESTMISPSTSDDVVGNIENTTNHDK